jgi:hypothetical protein
MLCALRVSEREIKLLLKLYFFAFFPFKTLSSRIHQTTLIFFFAAMRCSLWLLYAILSICIQHVLFFQMRGVGIFERKKGFPSSLLKIW